MENSYTSIESLLCSDDCSENYWKQVMGHGAAALGKGKRVLLWLQNYRPKIYTQLVAESVSEQQRESKVGRSTKNGHVMDSAERKREQRQRREAAPFADFRDISQVDTKGPETQNGTK